MKAVIFAAGTHQEMNPLLTYRPSCLLHIADKPIIYYVLEFLSQNGWKKIDLFISDFANLVEEQCGDGKRWGLKINYYLIRRSTHPFEILTPTAIGWDPEKPLLLGCADVLPDLTSDQLSGGSVLFIGPDKKWTGWGIVTPKMLSAIPPSTVLEDADMHIPAEIRRKEVLPNLSTQSLNELKNSNEHIISHQILKHSILSTARMVEPQIWISRAVALRPSTTIVPPVFIGENCQLGDKVTIGPFAVIENHSIIDHGSSIQHAIICQRSYVGEGLSINNCIVDRNMLIDLTLDTHIKIRDDFILSGVATPKFRYVPWLVLEKLFAMSLFLLFLPIFLIMWCIYPYKYFTFLKIPSPLEQQLWTTFHWNFFEMPESPSFLGAYFQRLPVLLNIIEGNVHFVGVAPRTVQDVIRLPPERQKLYLHSKVGIITLSNLDHGPKASADEQYASEVYYSTHMGVGYDFSLLFRWCFNKIKMLKNIFTSIFRFKAPK